MDNPVGLEELENTLVVFDDIDQIGTKAVQDAVWKLINVGKIEDIY